MTAPQNTRSHNASHILCCSACRRRMASMAAPSLDQWLMSILCLSTSGEQPATHPASSTTKSCKQHNYFLPCSHPCSYSHLMPCTPSDPTWSSLPVLRKSPRVRTLNSEGAAPTANVMASNNADLPEPLGPTMAVKNGQGRGTSVHVPPKLLKLLTRILLMPQCIFVCEAGCLDLIRHNV